jgi:hypothetical protein
MEVKQIEGAKAPSFEGLLFYVPVPVPVTGRAAAQARIAMGPTRPDPNPARKYRLRFHGGSW